MCMKSAWSSLWCKNATKRGKKWRTIMRTQECCMGRTKWQAFSLQCFCCFYGLGTKKKERKRKVERPQSARDRRPAARLRSRRPGGQTRRLFFFCFFFFPSEAFGGETSTSFRSTFPRGSSYISDCRCKNRANAVVLASSLRHVRVAFCGAINALHVCRAFMQTLLVVKSSRCSDLLDSNVQTARAALKMYVFVPFFFWGGAPTK